MQSHCSGLLQTPGPQPGSEQTAVSHVGPVHPSLHSQDIPFKQVPPF